MATSYYRNTNAHRVSLSDDRGQRKGSVFASDDPAYADLAGVEKVTKSDYDAYREGLHSNQASGAQSGDMVTRERVAAERVEHRRLTVAGPLQRVIGDDQAPLGPPTGVLSTKAVESEKDLAHALAFGPNEAKSKVDEPEEKFTGHAVPKGQLIHNEQVDASESANATAEELNETDRGQSTTQEEA